MKMNSVTDVDYHKEGIRSVLRRSKGRLDCSAESAYTHRECLDLRKMSRVMSVVGRYLEHPRIFSFGTGKEQKIYIGSAICMMTLNTEKE